LSREWKMGDIRAAYGEALVELGKRKEEVVVLDADLAHSLRTLKFKERFPERYFNVGIAEQNMVSIAAGLAACGKIPFVNSFAVFVPGRCYDQVRLSVGYTGLNVKLVGSHGGVSVGEDGASHQGTEDIALARAIPGMTVIVPADAVEVKKVVFAAAEHKGPVYIRLMRPKTPIVMGEDYEFRIGRAAQLTEGEDVTIVACGIEVWQALEAAEILAREGIKARVLNMSTIKPLDEEALLRAARETGAIVTAEDHTTTGGLGGAVSEFLSENFPVPVVRVGIRDTWGQSGPWEELLEHYGLTARHIVEAAKRAMALRDGKRALEGGRGEGLWAGGLK